MKNENQYDKDPKHDAERQQLQNKTKKAIPSAATILTKTATSHKSIFKSSTTPQ